VRPASARPPAKVVRQPVGLSWYPSPNARTRVPASSSSARGTARAAGMSAAGSVEPPAASHGPGGGDQPGRGQPRPQQPDQSSRSGFDRVPARPVERASGAAPPGEREQIGWPKDWRAGLVRSGRLFERGRRPRRRRVRPVPRLSPGRSVRPVVSGSDSLDAEPRPAPRRRGSAGSVVAALPPPWSVRRADRGHLVGYRRADHGHLSGTGGLTPVTGPAPPVRAASAPILPARVPPVGTREAATGGGRCPSAARLLRRAGPRRPPRRQRGPPARWWPGCTRAEAVQHRAQLNSVAGAAAGAGRQLVPQPVVGQQRHHAAASPRRSAGGTTSPAMPTAAASPPCSCRPSAGR